MTLQAASDWVYHGTTETFSQAVVGANLEWQGTGNLFAGVEAHQAVTPGVQQRHRSVMTYLGFGWALGPNWHTSTSVAHRFFPGSFKEWDYTELKLELAHSNGLALKLDYAPDYYHHNAEILVGEASFTAEISTHSYWYAQAGNLDFHSSTFTDYQFARVGAGVSRSRVNLDLSYGWNSNDGQGLFGSEQVRSPGLVLQFSFLSR